MAGLDLPKMADGFLGIQANKFEEYGLRTISHHEPVLAPPGNEVEVVIERTQNVRMMAKLVPYGTQKELPNQVLMNVDPSGSLITYKALIPGTGWFKLHIYALPPSEASHQLRGVYNYLVFVKDITVDAYQYPKQYGVWRDEGCCLYEPQILHRGHLGMTHTFKVRIPGANKVAIKAGEDWTMLESKGDSIWEADVDLSANLPPNSKVKVNCNFGGTSFSTLAEYTV